MLFHLRGEVDSVARDRRASSVLGCKLAGLLLVAVKRGYVPTRVYASEENGTEVFALLISGERRAGDGRANQRRRRANERGSLSFASRLISEPSRLSYFEFIRRRMPPIDASLRVRRFGAHVNANTR